MVKARWTKFEEQVRGVAELVWRTPCKARTIAGINFDGVIQLSEEEVVIVEASVRDDLAKVRADITNLNAARLALAAQGVVCRGWIVLDSEPTKSMVATAEASKINIAPLSSLAANFFEFGRYLNARLEAAFGSAIDPITGAIDTAEYVPVSYIDRRDGREIDIARVCDLLLEGKNVVLLGEYGSGKSRCIRQIFSLLALDWGVTFKFPFAINLRECWGLKSGKEILRRSLLELGLDDLESSAVRVFNTKNCILLIDGFDEVGSQSWSVDEDRLRQLRAQAVSGVKDAVRLNGGGCLIAGREHYFSSESEMFSALGLDKKNTVVLQAKDEFTDEEMASYFELTGVDVDLPSWLPRRPLICQTISTLTDNELERMFGIENQDAEFWNHFIHVLCERDARINANFDAATIYQVFLKLSRRTRNLPANVGPISQRTLQEAFEEVVGKLPVEEAAVMLLRLPSLGRIGLESSDRQFVDTFILDGLRARDIIGAIEADNDTRREIAADSWMNPLEPLGQSVLALELNRRFVSFRQLADQASKSENKTLCGDIIASAARSDNDTIFSFDNLSVGGASFSDLDFSRRNVENVEIDNAVIQSLVLPSSPPNNVRIKSSLVEKVSGASSFSGLPSWVNLSSVDRFDSVQTVAEIRRAGLSPAHEVLVSILKKTFMQKGAGRKEAALYRGFGSGSVKSIAQVVLPFLIKEGLLSRHKGNEGWIYSPERSQAARVGKILDQLRSCNDPLWTAVNSFN